MALIDCQDCGYKVSDQALACPRCARPIAVDTNASGSRRDEGSSSFRLVLTFGSGLIAGVVVSALLVVVFSTTLRGIIKHADDTAAVSAIETSPSSPAEVYGLETEPSTETDPTELTALEAVVETTAKLPEQGPEQETERQKYAANIVVRDVRVEHPTDNESGVLGEIKNRGNRTLSDVELTVYCLDRWGKTVFETSYHPVYLSGDGFGERSTPLKPNYTRKFDVKLDNAPSDWAGEVDIFVTDLKFMD